MQFTKNDFLGHLKGKDIEVKKMKILEIYRYLFRFSIERVKQFIDEPIMMLILLEYIKKTKLKRIHNSKTLKKYVDPYYRSIENMINLS